MTSGVLESPTGDTRYAPFKTHIHGHTCCDSVTKQVSLLYSFSTLFSLPGLYLPKVSVFSPASLQAPLAQRLCGLSRSPGTPRDRQRLWRPYVKKSVPAPRRPWAPSRAKATKEASMSRRRKSGQMLEPSAGSKAASRLHTFGAWKVFPVEEGADDPPVPLPCPQPSSGASPPTGALRQVAAPGWAQWRRRRLPSLPARLAPALPSFPKLRPPAPESPEPPPLRGRPSYLTMQHLVARFPGALLPRGLFPYLGGKRNRETEGGRRLSLGSFPPA